MIVQISTKDAEACLSRTLRDGSKFDLGANLPQTVSAMQVYMGLLEDLGLPYGMALEVKHVLVTKGISAFVTDCVSLAEGLLEGLGSPALVSSRDAYRWVEAFSSTHNIQYMARVLDWLCCNAEDDVQLVRDILQLLLFFERFTFVKDVSATEDALKKFRARNRLCRDFDRHDTRWPGPTIRAFVQEELGKIYTPADWVFNVDDAHFSSGATRDGGKTLPGKLKQMSEYTPMLYGCPMYPLFSEDATRYIRSVPRVLAVPKSLSSRRIIAPEVTVVGYYAQAALEALRRMLDRNGSAAFINEHDQSVNQYFARRGAAMGDYATIDLSGASDSIAKTIFLSCIPAAFTDMFCEYQSYTVSLDSGTQRGEIPLHILFTSGNPLTWLTEATWFLALGRTGCRLAGIENHLGVYAYGDDLIVPVDAYETVCEVLEVFGHTVNRRKSYGAGVFRESCGGWYYRGLPVTPTYWPRREVPSRIPDHVSSLCSLQHNLISAGYNNAALACALRAKDLYPGLTTSYVGSALSDLWDSEVDEYTSEKYRHTDFHVAYEADKGALSDPFNAARYEMYIYTLYLREGPLYTCALDKLLGTSTSRYDPLRDFGTPVLEVRRV